MSASLLSDHLWFPFHSAGQKDGGKKKQVFYPCLRNPSFIKANHNPCKGVYSDKKWQGEEWRGVRSSVLLLGGFTGCVPTCVLGGFPSLHHRDRLACMVCRGVSRAHVREVHVFKDPGGAENKALVCLVCRREFIEVVGIWKVLKELQAQMLGYLSFLSLVSKQSDSVPVSENGCMKFNKTT